MIPWILHHRIGVGTTAVAIVLLLWWALKPPTWRDGTGDNDGLSYLSKFTAGH